MDTNLHLYRDALFRKLEFTDQSSKKKRTYGNTKAAGKYAVDRVKLRITDILEWACTTEETDSAPIDVFAISLQSPLKITLIQVKSVYGDNRNVRVKEKDLLFKRGPLWVISVETGPSEFAYLVLTYKEICKEALECTPYDYGDGKSYYLSIPRDLGKFKKYQNKWYKIPKNARLYG